MRAKRILVTGGNSFIAKTIVASNIFSNYQIWHPQKETLDISNEKMTEGAIASFSPDFIIHCAYRGGSYAKNNINSYEYNIKMLNNLLSCSNYYKKLIVFGSGIEKSELNLISPAMEYYYWAKIASRELCLNNNKIIKINLFGCFGEFEDTKRFISTCIVKCLKNEDIIISEDRLFDFFYSEDVVRIIKHLIDNIPENYLEFDACYSDKFYLSNIAMLIRNLMNSNNKIIINSIRENYIGGDHKFNLDLYGVENGVAKMIDIITKRNNN